MIMTACPHDLTRHQGGELGAADLTVADAAGDMAHGGDSDLHVDQAPVDLVVQEDTQAALDTRSPDSKPPQDGPLKEVGPKPDLLLRLDLPPPQDAPHPPDLPKLVDLPWPPDFPPPPPDQKLIPDLPPLDLKPPPDSKWPADLSPPCGGVSCLLGCDTTLNRCKRLDPSNFSTKAFFSLKLGAVSSSISAPLTFNTSTGEVRKGTTVLRPGGSVGLKNGIYWNIVNQGASYPELSVFAVASLVIPVSCSMEVVGVRSFALYSQGGVAVQGQVQVVPTGTSPGAGGFRGGYPEGGSADSCFGGQGKGGGHYYGLNGGGGGGGRASAGGKGGSPHSKAQGGAAGGANGAASLVPLYGGCGGGAGGGGSPYKGGYGGGGGGAIQVAAEKNINITGIIWAPGAGGGGAPLNGGGGGGGSGGAILLEAPVVSVTGVLAANGGGGGVGGGVSTKYVGVTGGKSLGQALGGYRKYYGNGGAGAARTVKYSKDGTATPSWGGGGGGGGGRVRVNAPKLTLGTSNASPPPSESAKVGTW